MNQGDQHQMYGIYGAQEVVYMALCAYYEAQDQGEVGMLAVCWTIRNRADKPGATWWGDEIEDVVLKPWQFTAMKLKKGSLDELLPGNPVKNRLWDAALRMAERAYLRMGTDPTNGATHYYAPALVAEPAWVKAPGTIFRTKIKDHLFYTAN